MDTGTDHVWGIPPQTDMPYVVVANAQSTSLMNHGLMGIYRKANNDSYFSAAQEDMLGSWKCSRSDCSETGVETYDETMVASDILVELNSKGGLYDDYQPLFNAKGYWTTDNATSSEFSHLVAWSSSTDNGNSSPFQIRAAIEVDAGCVQNARLSTFECLMNAPEAVAIANSIDIGTALQTWLPGFMGIVYEGDDTSMVNDVEENMAWYLNSMIMVQGGDNSLQKVAPASDPQQGCVVNWTPIPIEVAVLLCIIGILTLLASCAWLVLFLILRRTKYYQDAKLIPQDLIRWMIQATWEHERGEDIIPDPRMKDRHLDLWELRGGDGEPGKTVPTVAKVGAGHIAPVMAQYSDA